MSSEPTYHLARGPDVHRVSRASPFAHVARRLRAVVHDLGQAAPGAPARVVVDIGCADRPYRDLFPADSYVGVDLPGNPQADLHLRPDGSVPLDDGSADLVLSTQVLEHVADPSLYLGECVRLLRPGGCLVLTTHGIMYLHRDPTDYWRWTSDGLVRIVEAAGLQVVETRGVLGLTGAALQLLQTALAWRVPRLLQRPFVVVFQLLIAAVDRAATEEARRSNGLVIAVRAVKR